MKHDSSQLPALIDLLRKLELEVTAEEVAEILWVAAHLPSVAPRKSGDQEKGSSLGRVSNSNNDNAVTRNESSDIPNSSSGSLYHTQAQSTTGIQRARSFRSPAAYALPDTLNIARHLRPLKRRIPSRIPTIFDEATTVHHIAATGEWLPIFKAAAERWLHVTLVVDESSSMVIWQRMINELKDLLERQGAFRTVSLWGFRSQPDDTTVILYSGIGPTANRSRPHRAAELYDPQGRRLVLVVSDCVAPVWHNGVMATLLAGWGRAGLVTLLQVLPDRLWVRSGLRTFPAIYLRSPTPGVPNNEFQFEWTTHRLPVRPPHSVPVPVASLDALPLGYWAQALAGNSNLWVPGVLAIPNSVDLATGAAIVPPVPVQRTGTLTAEQLLRNFYGSASPTARRLANFLAAAPLTLPIIRLVQQAVLPEARVAHLAEVFLSGLIDRPSQPDDSNAADSVEYFFVEGVRDRLLNNLRLTETINVLLEVSTYIGEHLAQPLDFGTLIADPKNGDLTIGTEYQLFAQIAAKALRRFGGDYVDLADRLETSLGSNLAPPASPNSKRTPTIERVPESRKPAPQPANPYFVDRIDELNWVMTRVRLLLARQLDRRTLIFTGVHGIGKTWFLIHLQQQLSQNDSVYVFRLDLAAYGNSNPDSVIQDILMRLNQELLTQPLNVTANWTEMSRLLVREIKQHLLTVRPLVLLVDSVYEASHGLLALLEHHLLGLLAVDPSVLIILAGRGQPYPFTSPELRLRAEFYTLQPLTIEWTEAQLQSLGIVGIPPVAQIQAISFGNPKANRLLAESHNLVDAFHQLLTDMVTSLTPTQVEKTLDYMLALSVPSFFDYRFMPAVFAAYYDDPQYLKKTRPEIMQMADLLIRPGYGYWDKERSFYVLHAPTRHWCLSYLKVTHPDKWLRITHTLLELFQQWSSQIPRTQAFWAAEIAYHQAELEAAGYSQFLPSNQVQ